MKKLVLCTMAVMMLIGMSGCFQKDDKDKKDEPVVVTKVATSIVLTTNTDTITADGASKATFTAVVKDQNSATMTGIAVNYYNGTKLLTGNTFKTITAASFNFTAKANGVTSNEVIVTSNTVSAILLANSASITVNVTVVDENNLPLKGALVSFTDINTVIYSYGDGMTDIFGKQLTMIPAGKWIASASIDGYTMAEPIEENSYYLYKELDLAIKMKKI